MTNTQARQIGEDLAHSPKTLQIDIFKRFMTDKELSVLMDSYYKNRKRYSMRNRFDKFKETVTEEDKELMRAYFNETLESSDLLEKYGYKSMSLVTQRLGKIALKLCFENANKLGL